jgi:ubiquitin carboxyl-terminal hydrolase 4/11/15
MPSSDALRIELFPPVLRISCLGESTQSFTIALSVLQTLGDMKAAANNYLTPAAGSEGQNKNIDIRFWRLPSDQGEAPLTNESLKSAGVELIAETTSDGTTLAEMQLDQSLEYLALEVKKVGAQWLFTSEGKVASSSIKGIFKQDGGDFLTRMQTEKTSSFSSLEMSSAAGTSAAGRMTRSQTAADRGSEKQRGLTGLYNLGNTCFMNAALQCMSNTKELKDYFVSGVYKSEINSDNPLGMGGAMANVFGELLKKLWNSGGAAWHPRDFKTVLSRFSPQFIGYAQQDTQELLAFLLDGLHEDLNRIVKKPYIEAPDWQGGGLEEMVAFAHKQWEIYKLRNDSVIVDLFQGQYRSTLVCPECGKVSIKFDPFMYLTLPIPNRKVYTCKVTYLPWNTKQAPIQVEMRYTTETSIGALKKKLATWFQSDAARMIACDVFNKSFFRVYGDFENATEIGANDVTYVYELPDAFKPIAPFPFKSNYQRREKVQDLEANNEVTKEDEKYALLPVFSLKKPMEKFSNYARNLAFGQPFFVAIAKEDVNDVEAVQRAVLERYKQYTSKATTVEDYLSSLADEDSQSLQEDWDMVNDGTSASSLVLPEPTDGGSQDMVAEIHEGGEVVHIVPDALPSRKELVKKGHSPSKGASSAFSLHFVVNREDHSPATLKPEGYLDYGEELKARASRSMLEDDNQMDTDLDAHLVSVQLKSEEVPKWPLVYSGGSLVCVWSDRVAEKLFEDDLAAWESTSSNVQFVDPELEAERSGSATGDKKPKASLSIDDCLNEFTKEEQLGESDPWYCPQCKDFKQATKKFDLWKVPDILVVHLKRFSSGRISRDKIDSFIEFPVLNLDLTDRVEGAKAVSKLHEEEQDDEKLMKSIGSLGADDDAVESDAPIYDLYAVDNHYGGLGGGHYTAYAKNPEDEKWYYFDDSSVRLVERPEEVKGKAAYLLFYRRRTTRPIGGKSREKVREKFKSEAEKKKESAHALNDEEMNHHNDDNQEAAHDHDEDEFDQRYGTDRQSPLVEEMRAHRTGWGSDEEDDGYHISPYQAPTYPTSDGGSGWDTVLQQQQQARQGNSISSSPSGSLIASIGDLDESQSSNISLGEEIPCLGS